jgi:protein-S-isoprenylcysteine O-methyltransferase Ste14
MYVALSAIALFSGASMGPGVREDRGNRWIFAPIAIIGTVLAFLPAYTDHENLWSIGGESVRWVGLVICLVGGILRIRPTFVLGHRFSPFVAIQPGHTLVTTGIYHFIRHPSYLGLLLSSAGWSLTFRSVAGLILTALMVPPLVARINAEERLLQEQFGADYEAYRARTARLIPGVY